jgi:hypothetical protein
LARAPRFLPARAPKGSRNLAGSSLCAVGQAGCALTGSALLASSLTLRNGLSSSGGGISNYGTLLVSDSTLSGNTAFVTCYFCLAGGGGIYNRSMLTTIDLAQAAPAGTFTLSGENLIQSLPAFCRVEGVIEPTTDSGIRFAVWMPTTGWNGRFRGIGNYGFAGEIEFADMAAAIRRGYSAASTDTGHRGGGTGAEWALKHHEKVVDFGYRAVHEMTVNAKAIIRSFYGQAPQWSYFEGSSNGGREALMEAQRFPDDYQGILAGAAPTTTTSLLTAALYNTYPGPATYIPANKIPAISAAVLNACDALDGISDGILNDPRQCHFDPSTLRCQGADSDGCLTSSQVSQLRKIYAGLRNSKGEQLFPGYMPGGEEGEDGWAGWITGSAPGQGAITILALNYFRDMVVENPMGFPLGKSRARGPHGRRENWTSGRCHGSGSATVQSSRRQTHPLSRLERSSHSGT